MRKVKEIKIETDNRDRGKRFRITEMSAMAQERWATKAVCALLNSGLALPEGMTAEDLQGASGLAKILSMGVKAFSNIKYELAEPLYAELLQCCEYLGTQGEAVSRPLDEATADEVIEEVSTLFVLRKEVLKLHFDFLSIGGNLTSASREDKTVPRAM